MNLYTKGDAQDYLLAQWWAEITADGSRNDLFVEPTSLGQTLAFFQSPDVKLVYEVDGRGIWFAMWFQPIFTGLAASMWCRRDRRGRREHLAAAEWAYDVALRAVPVLLGITTQERLLRAHQRLGYTIVGEIPWLIKGKRTWLAALTREGWAQRKARHSERLEVTVG